MTSFDICGKSAKKRKKEKKKNSVHPETKISPIPQKIKDAHTSFNN